MRKGKRYPARVCSVLLCILLLMGLLIGCTDKKAQEGKKEKKQIEIPMVLTVDPSTGKKNEEEVVKAFNKKYKGSYYVKVDWILETEEEYRQNLKRMNVTDQLPAILTDIRTLPSFYQRMIADGRIEDLSPYIERDSEWKEMIEPVVLEGCSEADGSIYLAPLSTAAFSCSGIFWNQELFAQAGITAFPETWEEFWQCCEKLAAHGITPLALHTDGTAWAPMLLATAELAASGEAGEDFMDQLYPQTYQEESGQRLAQTLSRLFTYTTEDALHTDFDASYNQFFSGEAAMLPNGYWMIDQIPEGWQGKTRFSAFPGNELISSPETFGWALTSGYSDEVKEGAAAFFKFRTWWNQKEKEALFDGKEAVSQVEADYIRAYENNPRFVPNYQVKWNSILQEETLGEYLPQMVTGKLTVQQFTQMEDESVRQFEEEQ